jgi:hypothetical protein
MCAPALNLLVLPLPRLLLLLLLHGSLICFTPPTAHCFCCDFCILLLHRFECSVSSSSSWWCCLSRLLLKFLQVCCPP